MNNFKRWNVKCERKKKVCCSMNVKKILFSQHLNFLNYNLTSLPQKIDTYLICIGNNMNEILSKCILLLFTYSLSFVLFFEGQKLLLTVALRHTQRLLRIPIRPPFEDWKRIKGNIFAVLEPWHTLSALGISNKFSAIVISTN